MARSKCGRGSLNILMATTFSLGSFDFTQFSTPVKISFGGTHEVVQHTNIGGSRSFDLMGDNPYDITITGIFYGENFQSDNDKLQTMRGTIQNFKYGAKTTKVVVTETSFDWVGYQHIEYTIICKVKDVVAPSLANASATQTVLNQVAIANAIASNSTVLANSVANLTTVKNTLRATSTANLNLVIPVLSAIQGDTKSLIAQADTLIGQQGAEFGLPNQSLHSFLNEASLLRTAFSNRSSASTISALAYQSIRTIKGG